MITTSKTNYHVRIKCDSGVQKLTDSTAGCYWERVYHDITWSTEETMDEALKALEKIFIDGRWVRGAWINQETVD